MCGKIYNLALCDLPCIEIHSFARFVLARTHQFVGNYASLTQMSNHDLVIATFKPKTTTLSFKCFTIDRHWCNAQTSGSLFPTNLLFSLHLSPCFLLVFWSGERVHVEGQACVAVFPVPHVHLRHSALLPILPVQKNTRHLWVQDLIHERWVCFQSIAIFSREKTKCA